MSDFLTTLKELREKATKGEWLRDHGPYDFDGAGSEAYADIYTNYEGSEDDAPDEILIAKYNDLIPEGNDNAALICTLVNAVPEILSLVEAAKAQLQYMDMTNDKGDLERNLRNALSALEAKQ